MTRKRLFSLGLMMVIFVTTFIVFNTKFADAAEENGVSVLSGQNEATNPIISVEEDTVETKGPEEKMNMFELIMKGGIVGWLIIMLSFIALGLAIDYAVTIRRSKFAPPDDLEIFKELLRQQHIDKIKKLAETNPSFLSQIIVAGTNEISQGYYAMIKAMEETAEEVTARLGRKIDHLNVIGNIAPMMGLLGTVVGMLRCFNEISQLTGTMDPKLLAGGIFEALVTTCMGLIVAIPSLYFYAIFKNRIDEFVGETSLTAEAFFHSFKPSAPQKGNP